MISPQGYKLGEAPESKNPFWGEGEDSNVNKIYATATVDDGTGVPSVSTTKTVSGNDITFGFDFHNLKGKKGDTGFSPSARVEQTETGATITVTDKSGTTTATVDNGTPGKNGFSPSARVEQTDTGATITVTDKSGTTTATVKNGTNGEHGVTPSVTATATVDNTTGTPSVNVTKSGTDEAPAFEFAFTGIKGADGQSIEGPAGPGVPAGGTAGQVLTKKSGTDYDTEWKDPTGGGASGRISFGGKSGLEYEPRMEEILYKSSMYFSKYIDASTSVTYMIDHAPVSDTINISGELNIPSDTPIETTINYYIGGDESVKSKVDYATMDLNSSDFTISLSSGNTINVTSLNITDIGSSDIISQKNALINVSFIVSNETGTGRGQATIDIGTLNVRGTSVYNTYYLEPQK